MAFRNRSQYSPEMHKNIRQFVSINYAIKIKLIVFGTCLSCGLLKFLYKTLAIHHYDRRGDNSVKMAKYRIQLAMSSALSFSKDLERKNPFVFFIVLK